MKAQITLTDDLGNTYVGEIELVKALQATKKGASAKKGQARPATELLKLPDFKMALRAFLKRHITRKSTGHQKFTMLLAWITGGSTSKTVTYEEVVAQWNKVKGLTGGPFNPAYTTRAKEANWVDTPKTGVYKLQSDWKEAFQR